MAEDSLIQHANGILVADMVQSADTTDDLELTQHAIEDGSTISDHAIFKPTMLELTLVQTEAPIAAEGFRKQSQELSYSQRPRGTQQGTAEVRQNAFQLSPLGVGNAVRGALTSVLSGTGSTLKWQGLKTDEAPEVKPLNVQVLTADQDVDRVNGFHVSLLALLAAVEPIVVTVKGQQLNDMIITSVKRTDSQGKVGCASFTLSLQQIRTVETQTVELPPVPKATAKKSRGKTETKEESREAIRATAIRAVHKLLAGGETPAAEH